MIPLPVPNKDLPEQRLNRGEDQTFRGDQKASLFQIFLENSPLIAWSTDRQFRLTSLSGVGLQKLSFAPETAVNKTLDEFFPSSGLQIIPELHHNALAGSTTDTQFEAVEKMYQLHIAPQWDISGAVVGVLGWAMDITEHKRVEKALQERILVLTQPVDDSAPPRFEDLFDVEEIQKIQDAFSDAMGVASVITDIHGVFITRPSNFCRLCLDIIRKTPVGMANCMHSDAELGKKMPTGPIVQRCLIGGLWDGGTSI